MKKKYIKGGLAYRVKTVTEFSVSQNGYVGTTEKGGRV
jgi:hypothetical protein